LPFNIKKDVHDVLDFIFEKIWGKKSS
jgi:hypothetical protein